MAVKDFVDPRVSLAADRTSLAKYRTQLALDRTLLAWIRTALTFATFGFGLVGFFRTAAQTNKTAEAVQLHKAAIHMGIALVLIGIIALVLSAISHWAGLRKLRRDDDVRLSAWPLSITVAALASILGLYGLWSLFYR